MMIRIFRPKWLKFTNKGLNILVISLSICRESFNNHKREGEVKRKPISVDPALH